MGTHVFIFSQDTAIPTLRELFDLAAGRGYTLKLSPDMFDEDEEEDAFLDDYMDSSEWRDVSFANQAGEWVLHIFYVRRGETNFTTSLDDFRKPLDALAHSTGKAQVIEHLDATQVFYDIQIGLTGADIFRPQDAIIGYFRGRESDMLYFENIDAYEINKQVILRRGTG